MTVNDLALIRRYNRCAFCQHSYTFVKNGKHGRSLWKCEHCPRVVVLNRKGEEGEVIDEKPL